MSRVLIACSCSVSSPLFHHLCGGISRTDPDLFHSIKFLLILSFVGEIIKATNKITIYSSTKVILTLRWWVKYLGTYFLAK